VPGDMAPPAERIDNRAKQQCGNAENQVHKNWRPHCGGCDGAGPAVRIHE
jgi:hypothetical protein